ncbi:diguanylate cyclase [Aeromonas veronii]
MKQYIFSFQSLNDYKVEIDCIKKEVNRHSKSVLVQIYCAGLDKGEALSIARITRESLHNCFVVCSSSCGVIVDGTIKDVGSVASITRFDNSIIDIHYLELIPGHESKEGDEFGRTITSNKDKIECIIFFITPGQVQSYKFIQAMGKHLKDIRFVGAGTDDTSSSFLLCNDKISKSASVAIILKGDNIKAELNTILGWKPIGRSVSITSAKNNRVYEIDDRPAEALYEYYIGSDKESLATDSQIFPLIFKRGGNEIARVSNEVNSDGSISFLTDVYEGESVRLGYGDIDTMAQETCSAIDKLTRFQPDAIFLFPCISRKVYIEEDIEHEIKPFERLAPTVGFLSQCEISSDCGVMNTLNAAYLTLGLKELSSKEAKKPLGFTPFNISPNAKRTSKLMYFMSKVTSELELANQELEKISRVDFLTGTLNRKAFTTRVDYELSKSRRYKTDASLVIMDIDFFKKVNDDHGHLVGDKVLQIVSKIVNSEIRESDIFARYGGEEFILFLPETGIIDAKEMTERIRRAIEERTSGGSTSDSPPVTCSFGVSAVISSDNISTLIKRADDALYNAKNNGRNRVEVCA